MQWGSCSPKGSININPALIKAPMQCIDYVLIHEICHLKEHNHSRRFYAMLAKYCVNWRKRKAELDKMAELLLAEYDFKIYSLVSKFLSQLWVVVHNFHWELTQDFYWDLTRVICLCLPLLVCQLVLGFVGLRPSTRGLKRWRRLELSPFARALRYLSFACLTQCRQHRSRCQSTTHSKVKIHYFYQLRTVLQ